MPLTVLRPRPGWSEQDPQDWREAALAALDGLDVAALARVPGTLVAFMGGARAERLAARLIEHGKPASTPTSLISRGTTDDEEVVIAPLGALRGATATPALVVIGDVVAVRAALALRRSAA